MGERLRERERRLSDKFKRLNRDYNKYKRTIKDIVPDDMYKKIIEKLKEGKDEQEY